MCVILLAALASATQNLYVVHDMIVYSSSVYCNVIECTIYKTQILFQILNT